MKRHWMDGGDGITNFSERLRPVFEQAIAAYGDANLYISDVGLHPGDGPSLCSHQSKDLSHFWRIFDAIKAGTPEDPEEVLP